MKAFLIFFLAAPAWGGGLHPLREPLERIRAKHFPEFVGHRIEIENKSCDGCSFRAWVRVSTAWRSPKQRTYVVFVDPDYLSDPADNAARDAVLAHELVHLRGYSRRSFWELAALAFSYFARRGFRIEYERSTDAEAVRLGFGPGLKIFRRWQKNHLTKKELQWVETAYLNPGEIDKLIASRAP